MMSAAGSIPVIFLPGIGGAARLWEPQLASFRAAGYEPLALDLPGYGARPPVDHMDFDMLAADVEAHVDRHGLARPVLVGHSFGGMIAQTCLRRNPDGYRAAVLSGTSPAFGDPTGEFQKRFIAARLGALDSGRSMAELAAAIADELMSAGADPAGRRLLVEVLGTIAPRSYRAVIHCLIGFDERANLGAIRIPVLCLVGEHDRNAPPSMMRRMAEKIPGARFVCLAGVGHMPNLEAPRAHDAAILDFLREAFARAPIRS